MRFKPKIREIAKELGMDDLLLVPKNGGLDQLLVRTLNEMGVGYMPDRVQGSFETGRIIKARGEDIPLLAEELYIRRDYTKAIGITGDDLFDEYVMKNPNTLLSLLDTYEWDDGSAIFRRPTLCLLSPSAIKKQGPVNIAVNAKYEMTSRIYLDEVSVDMGIEPTVNVYNGDTEATVAAGLNDMAIEIVYSGRTLDKYNLGIIDKVRSSDFAIIGVDESSPLILRRDFDSINERVKNPVDGSYTSKISADDNLLVKKIGEEFAEFIRAYITSNESERTNLDGEFCDMLYVAQAMLAKKGMDLGDATKILYRRVADGYSQQRNNP